MKKIRFLPVYCIVFLITISAMGQISLSFETEVNTDCNTINCWSYPCVLINEVMIYPEIYDGSIYGCTQDPPPDICGGEWIELHNPNPCMYIDISCFFIGSNAMDNSPTHGVGDYPATYIIPEGTIVPPLGFVIIRGENAPPVPAHLLHQNGGKTIEIIVNDPNRVCIGNGNRLYFPNHAGWFAFYDNNGVPQDAISWNDIENGIVISDPAAPTAPPCMNCSPCNPGSIGNCNYSGSLAPYSHIPTNRKNYLGMVGTPTDDPNTTYGEMKGLSFRRIPDAGEWASGVNTPTYGTCNSTCYQHYMPNCNGTATVTATGGDPPYTYIWDDIQSQTTATATNLCEGEYCVTVMDANSNVLAGCVYVPNLTLDVTATTTTPNISAGEDIYLNSDVSGGQSPYTYSWTGPDGFSSPIQNPIITNAQLSNSGIYTVTVTDDNYCKGNSQINIEVEPVNIANERFKNIEIYPNPAKNTIFILTDKILDEILIFDIFGKTIVSKTNFTGGEIDISEIVAGVYFIRLKYKDEIFVEKLIVE